MDMLGVKSRKLLSQAQELLRQAQEEIVSDIEQLKENQEEADVRLSRLEAMHDESAEQINQLQISLEEIRDSAIRGEIASGRRTKDVALKFKLTSGRVSQIAPRRKYNNG